MERDYWRRVGKLGCLAVLFSSLAPPLCGAVFTSNLLCGFTSNPIDVDDANPRLSWQLQATIAGERAQSQTAFQILVATSTNTLTGDQGDLWDSGKVFSSAGNTNYTDAALT